MSRLTGVEKPGVSLAREISMSRSAFSARFKPFVDADDIADVAVAALTDERRAGQLVLPPSTVTQAARSSSTIGAVGSQLCTALVFAPMLINFSPSDRQLASQGCL